MSVQPVDRRPRRWNEQRRNTNRCYTFGSSARVRSGAQTRVREQVLSITSEEPCFGVSNSTSRRA